MLGFREVVAADFEFAVSPGERPVPVCLVAHELVSGRRFRLWCDQFGRSPPYATGADVLFVAYYASAELGCYHVLGWPMPERMLDLFAEFRVRTNGLSTPAGNSLIGALAYFGLDSIGAAEKEDMRALVLRGGWSGAERDAILDYCESDVLALKRLLPAMLPGIDLPRALLRGRSVAAVAAMEHAGVPVDTDTLKLAAALSGDQAMQEAYSSGDPYLAFAKQAGAVPPDATKASHSAQRELFKACVLGVQYGMEWQSLALRIGQPPIVARELLRAHRQTYRRFWRWSDAAIDHAMLRGAIHTVFGWPVHVDEQANPRSLRNFPMQANGAEMLRLACCLATEAGVEVCAPVHDAVLICAPIKCLDEATAATRSAMAQASRDVLAGFELNTDAKAIRWPHRYADGRGREMWARVCSLVMAAEQKERALIA
jgi:hypothetical protein